MRVWVLLTQEQEIYWFSQGYLRLSSESYTLDNEN